MSKTIYDLELHEWLDLDSTINFCVYRVPGGWIYTRFHGVANQVVETFVPFNNEFEPKPKYSCNAEGCPGEHASKHERC